MWLTHVGADDPLMSKRLHSGRPLIWLKLYQSVWNVCHLTWSLQLPRWERKFSLAGDLADFSHSLGRRVQPQEIARIISQFVNFLQELIFSSNFYIGWDASLKIHRNMFIKPFSIFPNIRYFLKKNCIHVYI